MIRTIAGALIALVLIASPAGAQQSRDSTRDQIGSLLTIAGQRTDVNVAFHQSTKNPYNYVGSMTTGLANTDSLEIIIGVTNNNTMTFRVYPHYKGGYINLAKAKDTAGLMRRLLLFSDDNFLFWGADDSGDVFSGYTITLESGFPTDAIVIVLRSIHNTDKFVGTLRPFFDGSVAAP